MRTIRIRLFMVTVVLMAIGVVVIYSSSSMLAYETYGDSAYFLKRHLVFMLAGFALCIFFMSFDYIKLKKFIKPFLLLSISLLFLVLIPHIGTAVGGARRWINLRFVNFQPSEIAKMALILYAADILSRKQTDITSFARGFSPLMIVMGLCAFLILLEPDLGTAFAVSILVAIMAFVAGARIKHLSGIFLAAAPLMLLLIIAEPYRVRRILAFLNPWADERGTGFQIIQSFIALGSGGIFGVGLGHSQQKLFYLPSAHTDFIFSIIGEELGILGTISVIAMYVIFIWLGTYIASRARDLFGQFLGFGLVSMVALQVIINIAVVTGVIPTKGLPLPFISYGGSSLIYSMLSVAILLNIARHRR